jgi:segregation and condensation protein B
MEEFAQLTALVEALLFVSDRPVPAKELASFLPDAGEEKIRAAVSALASRYATTDSGLQIEEVAGGYRLSTRSELGEAVKEFFRLKSRQRLSRAALETLAIVAYKQPVTNPEIQEIRGVSADGVLRTLLERRLVRIVGRKETVGKPLLYGTTRAFLEQFGLAALDDLPPVEEFGDLLGEAASEGLGDTLCTLPGGAGDSTSGETVQIEEPGPGDDGPDSRPATVESIEEAPEEERP